jgi:arylsulfatase A-like enzyme
MNIIKYTSSRRQFIKNAMMGTAAFMTHPLLSCSKREHKPNIIFIMADDLGYGDLGCHGQHLIQTPKDLDGISIVDALFGDKLNNPHEYLYWDYGHCRERYEQAVRFGNWKGIREGQNSLIQLYDLKTDIGETNDLADKYPEIVKKINEIIQTAVTPSERYTVGKLYEGKPIWKKKS